MARSKLNWTVMAVAFGAAVSQPALAGGGPTPPQLYITSVQVDFDAQVMVVLGENFDKGKTPVVTLGEALATTSSHTATTIVAVLPAGIEAGDYLLTVSTGNGVKNFDTYDLTLGAVGPKGGKPAHEWSGTALRLENPDGSWGSSVDLRGPAGPQGDQGPQGLDGNLALAGQVCPSCQVLVGFDDNGNLICQDSSALCGGGGSGPCVPDEETLCLHGSRFEVQGTWRDFQGNEGPFHARPASDGSGSFWFFDDSNIELLVMVVDGCRINGHYWSFFAASTNLGFTMYVADLQSGTERVYENPVGVTPLATTDVTAFATCP